MLTSKACSKCGEDKPLEDFHKRAAAKDGRRSYCRPCASAAHEQYRRDPEVQQRYTEQARAWVAANPEAKRAKDARWYAANTERVRANNARWRAAHPETVRIQRRARISRYRARKRGATSELFTVAELYALWADADAWACIYCGAPWEHIEHFVPLARGGDHALWNLFPACAECNLSKSARDPYEFLRSRGVPGI